MNIKVTFNNEVRRILLKTSEDSMVYSTLEETCKNLFTTRASKPFEIFWKDEDGDIVVISSDMELSAAVHTMSVPKGNLLRFFVREKTADSSAPSEENHASFKQESNDAPEVIHHSVTCDECGMSPIVGIRYKCAVREDYDLCEACECAKEQPYPVVKITDPSQAPISLVYVFAEHQPNGVGAATGEPAGEWQRGARPGYHAFGGPFQHHGHHPPRGFFNRRPPHFSPHGPPPPHFLGPRGPPPHGFAPPPPHPHPHGPPPPPPQPVGGGNNNPFAQVPPCVNRFTQRCERKVDRLQKKLEKVNEKMYRAVNDSAATNPFFQAVDSMMTNVFGGQPAVASNHNQHHHSNTSNTNNVRTIPIVTAEPVTSSHPEEQLLEDELIAQAIHESLQLNDEKDGASHPSVPAAMIIPVQATAAAASAAVSEETTAAVAAMDALSRSTAGVYTNTMQPAVPTLPKPALRFVKDITFPNDTVVQPGAHFVKVWRMRNDGIYPWPEDARLISAGGDEMCSPTMEYLLPTLAPNQEGDVAVELVAPDMLGRYTAYFRAQTKEEQKFGHRLWATIVVADQEAEDWHMIAQEQQQESVTGGSIGITNTGISLGNNNGIGFASAGMDEENSVFSSSTPTIPAPTITTTQTNASGGAVATVFGKVVDISPVMETTTVYSTVPDKVVEEVVMMTPSTTTSTTTTTPTAPVTTAPVVSPPVVIVTPGSVLASVTPPTPMTTAPTPTAPTVTTAVQSRALLWRRELAILEDMGFTDFEAILPLLHEHLGCPVALQEDKRAAPNVDGMQRVVTALLTTHYI